MRRRRATSGMNASAPSAQSRWKGRRTCAQCAASEPRRMLGRQTRLWLSTGKSITLRQSSAARQLHGWAQLRRVPFSLHGVPLIPTSVQDGWAQLRRVPFSLHGVPLIPTSVQDNLQGCALELASALSAPPRTLVVRSHLPTTNCRALCFHRRGMRNHDTIAEMRYTWLCTHCSWVRLHTHVYQ